MWQCVYDTAESYDRRPARTTLAYVVRSFAPGAAE